MSTVVVTGGAGYVGSHAVKALAAAGDDVVVYDDLSGGHAEAVDRIAAAFPNRAVSLVKGGRPLLSQVKMGLGWEPAFRGKDIDLDASVIAYGPNRNHLDSCYFGKLSILNGAIKHSGDNLTGEGAGGTLAGFGG